MNYRRPAAWRRFCQSVLVLLSGVAGAGVLADNDLETSRDQFQQAWQDASKGHWQSARKALPELQHYPLTPYLQAKLLQPRRAPADSTAVQEFLQQHADSAVAIDVRRQWLAAMARSGHWQEYLRHYAPDTATTQHQCWYLQALQETGAHAQLLAETSTLWMQADSLPNACDRPFRFWLASGQRTQPMVWGRLQLALEHNRWRLARYLVSELKGELKSQGQHLLKLHRHPQLLPKMLTEVSQGPHAQTVVEHSLIRLARIDYSAADHLWVRLTSTGQLGAEAAFNSRQAIARQVIAAEGEAALPWLLQRDPDASDEYLLEWRIRLAMRELRWRDVSHWTALLPAELAQSSRWRYWHARAVLAQPSSPEQAAQARRELAEVATERDFYGFLAADQLSQAYSFREQTLLPAIAPAQLNQLPAVARAREWLTLGEQHKARREWYLAIKSMDRKQLQAATLLADSWGWHGQAIRTAIRSESWNDLRIRFPLAYSDAVQQHANKTAISPPWLFAVARQESAFTPDARSPAGARGLLQLMPSTARELAGQLGRRYSLQNLYDADYSLALGSRYLADLLEEFGGNRILATAAYNAGPDRINRVLGQQRAALPADVWIETLPYFETRGYVQNVLSFSVIYSHRLGQTGTLLTSIEREVPPSQLLVRSRP